MNLDIHPQALWDVPGGLRLALPVWAALAGAAWADMRSGRVPGRLLLAGAGIAAVALLSSMPPLFLLGRLLPALLCGGLIWAVNEIWYRVRQQDALGMGDAQWSMLATLAFGMMPVLWAWAVAAWLGLAWMALLRRRQRTIRRVFFTPFLLAGLVIVKMLLPQ